MGRRRRGLFALEGKVVSLRTAFRMRRSRIVHSETTFRLCDGYPDISRYDRDGSGQ
jgi:hypothetical protein